MARFGQYYHNHQAIGDLLESSDAPYVDACSLLYEFYRNCMNHKEKTGLTQRLVWARNYLTTDRPTHIVFGGKQSEDEDCDKNCPEITVNFDFIGSQFNIAYSIYEDALKARGQDYVTVKPTPISQVSDESKERIRRSSFNAIANEVLSRSVDPALPAEEQNLLTLEAIHGLLGTSNGLSKIDDFVARQRRVETGKANAEAQVKAANAKALIDDLLTQSNYDDIMRVYGAHAFWFDYAVVRGPFTAERKFTEVNEKGFLREAAGDSWSFESVHPLNHFFAEDTTFSDMGSGEGDVTWLNKSDLYALKEISGANAGDINHVLKNFDAYQYGQEYSHSHKELDDISDVRSYRIPVIRCVMKLDKKTIKDVFGDTISNHSAVVEAWFCIDRMLYKKVEPRHLDYNPYRKNAFQIRDFSEIPSARGIYSLLSSAQNMIDNAAISLFSNLQDLPRYLMEIDMSRIKDKDELEDQLNSDRPIILTQRTGFTDPNSGGGNNAIQITSVPSKINEFVSVLREGIAIMQQLGFSPFALGQQNLTGVRSTGLGVILQQNNNKQFTRFLTAQEKLIETPMANYIWVAEAIKRKDKSIIVDGEVVIQSYSGFLQKSNQAEDLNMVGQNLVGFFNRRALLQQAGQDTSWLDSLISQYAEAAGFDGDLPFGPDIGDLADPGVISGLASPPVQTDGRQNLPADLQNIVS